MKLSLSPRIDMVPTKVASLISCLDWTCHVTT